MTNQEAARVLGYLTASYRGAGDDFNEANVAVWVEQISDLDFPDVMTAAKEWVRRESRFPTIAELRQRARPRAIPDLPALPPAVTTPEAIAIAKQNLAKARAELTRKQTA